MISERMRIMNEYSITYEELREIIDLIASGLQCDKLEDGYTLYIKLTKGDKNKEFDFVHC